MLESGDIQPEKMNENAREAINFMSFMVNALQNGRRVDDLEVRKELERHIAFLNEHSFPTDVQSFAAQTKFFLSDGFHRKMLENQQIGLSYYLFAVAQTYVAFN